MALPGVSKDRPFVVGSFFAERVVKTRTIQVNFLKEFVNQTGSLVTEPLIATLYLIHCIKIVCGRWGSDYNCVREGSTVSCLFRCLCDKHV